MNTMLLNMLDEFLKEDLVNIVLNILSFIPKIVYFLVTCLLSVLDLFQVVFRKLAGLDPIIIDGTVTKGDSTYQLIIDAIFNGKYPALNTIFWSIIILGVFMLIVTSIIATIRVEYNPDKEKGNSKSNIIKNFLKGIFSLLIIPIASIFGMFLANELVGVVDTITSNTLVTQSDTYQYFDTWGNEDIDEEFKEHYKSSYISYNVFGINIPTTAEPFSGMVFKASAYTCNRFRLHGDTYLRQVNNSQTDLGIFSDGKVTSADTAANIIDTAFAINAKINNPNNFVSAEDSYGNKVIDPSYYDSFLAIFGSKDNLTCFSKYNVELVWFFYNLWSYNYIVSFVAIIVIAKLYANFCLMLFSRIFEVIGLFIFAPIAVSIMPLDNGSALGRWRITYIGKFGLIFVTIFAMNIVSPIIAVMQQIKFFGSAVVDYVVQTIMIVAALSAVNGIISSISTMLFDKGSSYDSSMSAAKNTSENLATGLNNSKALFNGVAGFTVGNAARGLRWGATQTARGIRNGVYEGRQRRAIRNEMQYDRSREELRFNNMTDAERRSWGEGFLDTAEGQLFMSNVRGATDQERRDRALDMIERNRFHHSRFTSGTSGRNTAQAELFNFRHRQNVFEHTATGENLAGQLGTAQYERAMQRFENRSERQQATEVVRGSSTLNRHQEDIRARRAEANARWSSVGRTTGRVINTATNTVKPVTGTLQRMVNLIPGMRLFMRQNDNNR